MASLSQRTIYSASRRATHVLAHSQSGARRRPLLSEDRARITTAPPLRVLRRRVAPEADVLASEHNSLSLFLVCVLRRTRISFVLLRVGQNLQRNRTVTV